MQPRIKALKWKPAALDAVENLAQAILRLEELNKAERRHARDLIERVIINDQFLGDYERPELPADSLWQRMTNSRHVVEGLAAQLDGTVKSWDLCDAAANMDQVVARWRALMDRQVER